MYFQDDFTAKKKQQQEEGIKFSLKTARILNCSQLGGGGAKADSPLGEHTFTQLLPQRILSCCSYQLACALLVLTDC